MLGFVLNISFLINVVDQLNEYRNEVHAYMSTAIRLIDDMEEHNLHHLGIENRIQRLASLIYETKKDIITMTSLGLHRITNTNQIPSKSRDYYNIMTLNPGAVMAEP
jgi:hypothetical protein